jgi:hypothetical protein
MKKLIFVSLMAMLTGSAWAEWVWYSGSNEASVFYDPATIRKDGNMRRVWELQNLVQQDEVGAMSSRALKEYDCKQERYRILDISEHSGPMAGGKVLTNGIGDGRWRGIAPDTLVAVILKIVCAKQPTP